MIIQPKHFFVLLMSLFNFIINAQENTANQYKFRHYSVEDGLSQNTVNCILQDRRGFIWIGTLDGLNKFDGYNFKQYKYNPGDSNCLSAPSVMGIFEDDDGKLWIGTDRGGLDIFDPLTEKFTIYKNIPRDNNSLSNDRVFSICHDTANFYWVSTFGGGLNLFDTISKTFRHIKNDGSSFSLSNDNIIKIIIAADGLLYVATKGGLNVIDWKNRKIKKYVHNENDPLSLADNRLQNAYEDRKGNIWICTYQSGIYKLDKNSGRLIQYKHGETGKQSLSGNYVNDIFEDAEGLLWIATFENGINIFNPSKGDFQKIINVADDIYSLSNNHILCMYQDRQGIVWVGTNGGGINLYHKNFGYFASLSFLNKNNPPESRSIYSITEDSLRRIWFGTNGAGLFCCDRFSDKIKQYNHEEGHKNSISNNSIWSLLPLNNHSLIAGTFGTGLNLMDFNSDKIINLKRSADNVSNPVSEIVLSLLKENDSTIWEGTMRTGIDLINLKTLNRINYSFKEKDTTSLSSNYIYSIYKAKDGTILAGTQRGGINIMNENRTTFYHYKNNPTDVFSLNNNDVQCIYEDQNGILWLGTNGGGLNAFNRKTKQFIHYTERDGLPNNVVYGILSDKKGTLWLSTNNGLCRFTLPSEMNFNSNQSDANRPIQIRNYNVSDGISSNEFNQGAYYQNKEGWIYFGSINGITCFHPDSVKENTYKPPVVITGFKVFEKIYPLDTLIENKKVITLTYNQDFFSFEFAGLNYLLPKKNQYAVMLVGFNKDWVYTGDRRYMSYTNLDPETYTFKVKASNNDGVWSDRIAAVQIIITPPFWMTAWFKTLMVILLISAVYTIYLVRIRRIREEERKKTAFNKVLAEVEMKALRAQMNPHFIFNSLNSINKYIVAKDQHAASDYLARFSRLIRLVLENSMHKEVSLNKDIEALELYMQMEQLRFEKGFEYEIKIAEHLETESILIPPLLLQPFVENAIWHGLMHKESAGKILIEIKSTDHSLRCIVEDNGVGRKRAGEIKAKNQSGHQSLGMKVTAERIEILKQKKNIESKVVFYDLKDENGNATGTQAEIFIPLEYSY